MARSSKASTEGFRPVMGHRVLTLAGKLPRSRTGVGRNEAVDAEIGAHLKRQIKFWGSNHCWRAIGVVPDLKLAAELGGR